MKTTEIKEFQNERGLTDIQLAKAIGMNLGTFRSYKSKGKLPAHWGEKIQAYKTASATKHTPSNSTHSSEADPVFDIITDIYHSNMKKTTKSQLIKAFI